MNAILIIGNNLIISPKCVIVHLAGVHILYHLQIHDSCSFETHRVTTAAAAMPLGISYTDISIVTREAASAYFETFYSS